VLELPTLSRRRRGARQPRLLLRAAPRGFCRRLGCLRGRRI